MRGWHWEKWREGNCIQDAKNEGRKKKIEMEEKENEKKNAIFWFQFEIGM